MSIQEHDTVEVWVRPMQPMLVHLQGTKEKRKTLCKHYPIKKLEQRNLTPEAVANARWCTDCFMSAMRDGVIRLGN